MKPKQAVKHLLLVFRSAMKMVNRPLPDGAKQESEGKDYHSQEEIALAALERLMRNRIHKLEDSLKRIQSSLADTEDGRQVPSRETVERAKAEIWQTEDLLSDQMIALVDIEQGRIE